MPDIALRKRQTCQYPISKSAKFAPRSSGGERSQSSSLLQLPVGRASVAAPVEWQEHRERAGRTGRRAQKRGAVLAGSAQMFRLD